MSSLTRVKRKVSAFDSSVKAEPYTKVIVNVSDEVSYTAGTDEGKTLEVSSPWGTQAVADNILARITGFRYQPYTASDAVLDPAAEIGDAVSVCGLYGGIYSRNTNFGRNMRSTIAAPEEKTLEHEFPYIEKTERKAERRYKLLRSEFKIQAGEISAKVSKEGGDPESFGWVLNEDSWTVKANNRDILKATKDGLEIYGKITATSGTIGGLDIKNGYLSSLGKTWEGENDDENNASGIYFGPQGIKLGNFSVNAAGELEAFSGKFRGYVNAGNIRHGDSYGTFSGSGISSSSITTTQISGGINTSLGYADYSNGVFNGYNKPSWIKANQMTLGNYDMGWVTINYVGHDGVNRSIRVVAGQ